MGNLTFSIYVFFLVIFFCMVVFNTYIQHAWRARVDWYYMRNGSMSTKKCIMYIWNGTPPFLASIALVAEAVAIAKKAI